VARAARGDIRALAVGPRCGQDGAVPKPADKGARLPESNGSPSQGPGPKPRKGRDIVAPSSRVNVAFPFSQIKLEEPSRELAELAGLVFDLVVAMAQWVPEDQLEELQARAQTLRERLR
jgi:hypothetical protein